MNERYLTVNDVCEILHKHRRTIYFYIKSGQLKAIKPGGKSFIIYESDLKEFMNKGVERGSFQATYPRPHKKAPKE